MNIRESFKSFEFVKSKTNLKSTNPELWLNSFGYPAHIRIGTLSAATGYFKKVWIYVSIYMKCCRAVASEGGWGEVLALPPPVFSQIVNPISTRGDRLCPPQYYEPPSGFSDLVTALYCPALFAKKSFSKL